MTITDMARMLMNADRYQRGSTQPKYPNGAAVAHPDTPDDGMDITGMTAADFHIIPVSKEIEQKVRDRVFENMKYRYGMTGTGNEYGEMVHSYLMSIPAKDRRDAAYTIDQIHFDEVEKINAFVKSRVPGWQPGQSFDTSILEEYRQETARLASEMPNRDTQAACGLIAEKRFDTFTRGSDTPTEISRILVRR